MGTETTISTDEGFLVTPTSGGVALEGWGGNSIEGFGGLK